MARLSGKQILLVVAQKNYNETEFNYLNGLFTDEGAVVTVASHREEKALGRLEGFVVPQVTIAAASPADYEAMVIIGGYGSYTSLWDDPEMQKLVQQFNEEKKLIAACSVSPVILANAGILQGKKATVYPDYNAAVILQEKGANHVYDGVVIADNIITSNHQRKLEELGEAVISKLTE